MLFPAPGMSVFFSLAGGDEANGYLVDQILDKTGDLAVTSSHFLADLAF